MNLILYSYDELGNLNESVSMTPHSSLPPPTRLAWDFSSTELTKTIEDAYSNALEMIDVNSVSIVQL